MLAKKKLQLIEDMQSNLSCARGDQVEEARNFLKMCGEY
jgi:hypothetical protein